MSYTNIPAELKQRAQWINWRYDKLENGAVTKIPVNPHSHNNASVSDPQTWSSFEHVCYNAQYHPGYGIGFVFTRDDPYCGIDLDSLDKANEVHMRILGVFPTYGEWSPSGKGVHLICHGAVISGVNNRTAHVEVYSEARFFTFTGNIFNAVAIIDCQPQLTELYDLLASKNAPVEVHAQPEIKTDDAVLQTAWNAINGAKFQWLWYGQGVVNGKWQSSKEFPSQSEADQALVNILQFYTQNPEQIERLFRRSALASTLGRKSGHSQDYLNRTITRAFDRSPPLIDFGDLSKSNPAIILARRDAATLEPAPKPDTSENPFLERLPGLAGEIQEFVLLASPKPLPALATAAALAFLASLAGRAFNVSGNGLNLYILVLAPTGSGKDGMKSSLDRLTAAMVSAGMQSMDRVRGMSQIASYSALVKMIAAKPCCLSILGEFAHDMKKYSTFEHSSANNTQMSSALLEFYQRSGVGQSFDGMGYSDKEKNVSQIKSPAFSILAESNPELFFKVTNEDTIHSGLLPRFEIIEHTGADVPLNENASMVQPSPQFIDKCCQLAKKAFETQARDAWLPIVVQFDQEAFELDKKFRLYIDGMIAGKPELVRALWTRIHMRSLKLAGLIAVGDCYDAPVISKAMLLWAQKSVVYVCENLLRRVRNGDLEGSGDIKGERQMADVIHRYFVSSANAIKAYRPTKRYHDAMLIDRSYMQRALSNHVTFKTDNRAFDRILGSFVKGGVLRQIDRLDNIRAELKTTADLYSLLDPDELSKFTSQL